TAPAVARQAISSSDAPGSTAPAAGGPGLCGAPYPYAPPLPGPGLRRHPLDLPPLRGPWDSGRSAQHCAVRAAGDGPALAGAVRRPPGHGGAGRLAGRGAAAGNGHSRPGPEPERPADQYRRNLARERAGGRRPALAVAVAAV